MNKYVFCDLDFTLLDANREISKKNYDAIVKFESLGNKFIISSGRVPFALKQYKDYLHSKDIISSNGAFIISCDRVVKSNFLSKEVLKALVDYSVRNNIYTRFFTDDFLYILNKPLNEFQSYIYSNNKILSNEEAYSLIENCDIIKLVFCSNERDQLEKVYDDINKLNLPIELVYSSDIFLEVNSINQNKGNGIIDYCNLMGIDIKDTIAIGDNDNDLSMFKVASYTACPSNAIDKIKSVSDYVSFFDFDHDAVADILEHILNEKN